MTIDMTSLSRGGKQSQFSRPCKARDRAERIFDRRGFVSAVNHTVGAFVIAPRAVSVPFRQLHQFTEGFGVAFLKQIAGFLPAKHVIGWITPGGALIVAASH